MSESVSRYYAQYIQGGGDGDAVLTTPGRGADLGYDQKFLEACGLQPFSSSGDDASELFAASCGSGCPLRLPGGPPREGEVVVDLGCGAGHDVVLASRMVGASGRVIGVDLTREMIDAAGRNARLLGINSGNNVTFVQAAIDDRAQVEREIEGGSIDVVISNGVINLCRDKRAAFQTAFWLLKPGGRLLLSDLCLVEENPDASVSCSVGDGWSS